MVVSNHAANILVDKYTVLRCVSFIIVVLTQILQYILLIIQPTVVGDHVVLSIHLSIL